MYMYIEPGRRTRRMCLGIHPTQTNVVTIAFSDAAALGPESSMMFMKNLI